MDRSEQGRRNRKVGKDFEVKVRTKLSDEGWIVCRFDNQVNLENGYLEQSKPKFNPFTKMVMNMSSGFPDFIAFFKSATGKCKVRGVECKLRGVLTKEEKEKCVFLLENKIFNDLTIASKDEDGKINFRFLKLDENKKLV